MTDSGRPTVGTASAVVGPGDVTAEMDQADIWTDEMLSHAGIPVHDSPFVTVGGGIGSFVMVDFLRVYGMPSTDIKVLTQIDYPWQTYEYLTRCSQIPERERIRSDSASMPDCLWGFPSYALREAWAAKTLAPMWNVLTEPILCNYWTPRAGTVFRGLKKEADRISYWDMMHKGRVRMARRRHGGGYFTILSPPEGTSPTQRVALRSRVVHLAIGYPGLKFLPDLQEFRQSYPQSASRVVNAYEPHEHVYDDFNRRPGTVLIRGGGIVASRILQRLIDDRERLGSQTRIFHLFRTYIDKPHGPNLFNRRDGANGWAYQGFNYPKSAWGGQLWKKMRTLEGEERAALYHVIGGTNTPHRKSWEAQQGRGRAEGWYRTIVGEVRDAVPGDGTVITHVHDPKQGPGAPVSEITANYVIDCTGLEADIAEHRVLADLLKHSGAGHNPLGRLDVERTFEVRGTRSEPGRMYAVGTSTLGGYFPGVDTFLGLQLAAREVADDMASIGMLPKMGSARSLSQWLRWAQGKQP
jgi:hypothetical protein